MKIGPPDVHYLFGAIGWLELGNAEEALAELDQINPTLQGSPDILELRWAMHVQMKNWDEALKVARKLVEMKPGNSSGWLHQAYALRRANGGGLQKALETLKEASEKFPDEPTIAYNLSCYACQLQQLSEARSWFERALKVGKPEELKKMALADEDLAPLWPEIQKL